MKYDIELVKTRPLSEIRLYVDDLTMYRYYISNSVNINSKINSPLRKDKNPSFSIYPTGIDKLMWKDFGTGESGDIVKLVRLKYGISHKEALRKIWIDLCDGKKRSEKPLSMPIKNRMEIIIDKKRWSKYDENYWGRYKLTIDILKKFNVTPIYKFWYGSTDEDLKLSNMVYENDSPLYAYKIYGSYKIYKPLSTDKSFKWRSNTNNYDIQGLEQLTDKDELLIITKSLKDVMVLTLLGYNAVAPQSENSVIPKVIIKHLLTRFNKMVILYDNDVTGIKSSTKLSLLYDLEYITIPPKYRVKDISDFIETYGLVESKKLLNSLLNTQEYD